MSTYKELEEALSLVENLCTADQVTALLRTRKGDEHVRISAESKSVLVRRNLREAVEMKAIDLIGVFDLIRLSEENGNQHIYYYRPKTRKLAEVLTLEYVARQLWGSGFEKAIRDFPSVRLKPNDYRYSDLRYVNPKKPKDWLLKVYGHSVITKSTGRTEKRDENTVWREYVEEPLRSVLLARWNHPDILEIRVQRDESRKRVEEWHDKVWEMLKPALVIDQFDRWELAKPMKRLVLEQDKNANAYTFRDASVIDAEGSVHADFQTYSDQGNLFANMQARDSINGFLAANSSCTGLTVTWIARPDGTPQKDLRTILGVKGANEIILSGHCLGGDVDYVTDQLRSFSKTAS